MDTVNNERDGLYIWFAIILFVVIGGVVWWATSTDKADNNEPMGRQIAEQMAQNVGEAAKAYRSQRSDTFFCPDCWPENIDELIEGEYLQLNPVTDNQFDIVLNAREELNQAPLRVIVTGRYKGKEIEPVRREFQSPVDPSMARSGNLFFRKWYQQQNYTDTDVVSDTVRLDTSAAKRTNKTITLVDFSKNPHYTRDDLVGGIFNITDFLGTGKTYTKRGDEINFPLYVRDYHIQDRCSEKSDDSVNKIDYMVRIDWNDKNPSVLEAKLKHRQVINCDGVIKKDDAPYIQDGQSAINQFTVRIFLGKK